MPSSVKDYVHRVGRTARAGKAGRATTLVGEHEARWFWRSVVRGEEGVVGRSGKVRREDGGLVVGKEEREAYERALEELGREVKR